MVDKAPTLQCRLAICDQIARLAKADLPIVGELSKALQHSRKSTREYAAEVERRIAAGHQLSEVLTGDGSRDARCLAACIEAGEASGELAESLQTWMDYQIGNTQERRRFRIALIYPSLLMLITLISLSLVMWILIPLYRSTYQSLEQTMPAWLEAIVWIRERMGAGMFALGAMLLIPITVWLWRERGFTADGLPRESARRSRLQSLAASLAGQMLVAQVPLQKIVGLAAKASGVPQAMQEKAFSSIQNSQLVPGLSEEVSLLLSSLHLDVLEHSAATEAMHDVAIQLRRAAEVSSARKARWVPMLVALTVGVVVLSTYVVLIYLPWVWVMQSIVDPSR